MAVRLVPLVTLGACVPGLTTWSNVWAPLPTGAVRVVTHWDSEDAVIHVSAPNGQFVSSHAYIPSPSGMVLEDVREGSFVTAQFITSSGYQYMSTVAVVSPGDTLYFAEAADGPAHERGEIHLSIPEPGVPFSYHATSVGCVGTPGVQSFPLPHTYEITLTDACFTPMGPLHAVSYLLDRNWPPLGIAFGSDLVPNGATTVALQDFNLNPGRVSVTYRHTANVASNVVIDVLAGRDGAPYDYPGARLGATVLPNEGLQTQHAVDGRFHDSLYAQLSVESRDAIVSLFRRLERVPEDGRTVEIALTPRDLPQDFFGADYDEGSGEVTGPLTPCGGMMVQQTTVKITSDRLLWKLAFPASRVATIPRLDPEWSQQVGPQLSVAKLTLAHYSYDGPTWSEMRQYPLRDGGPAVWVHHPSMQGDLCGVEVLAN